MLIKLLNKLNSGIFDDDLTTSLLEELKYFILPPSGPYAKDISKVLKWQSKGLKLGKHEVISMGDIWGIIKSYKTPISNIESLKSSLQDHLSKRGCKRQVGFLFNPLRLILYADKPVAVSFFDSMGFMHKGVNAFATYENKLLLCQLDLSKEKFTHGLIAGITGSGKSVMLRNFIYSLAYSVSPKDNTFLVLNPKKIGFEGIEILPHVIMSEDIEDSITALYNLMQTRLEGKDLKPNVYVFADEVASFSKEAKNKLKSIAEMGRALNIHLILATQKPTSSSVPTDLKSQMTFTLTGMVSSKADAFYASGQQNSGAENLTGKGVFIFNAPGYNNVLVQALMSEGEDKEIQSAILAKWGNEKFNEGILEMSVNPIDQPKYVADRIDWIDTLNKEMTIKQVQDSHYLYYNKQLNRETAIKIVSWIGVNK